ncbi:RdRP-domain-containing protein [Zopfia rhizophila CBS 207.26]|uniref:RNA-dependent RNA polymerase n=1 Tax=Zopfia rhizophila CBS 207.26 TaxID=1314779 RepID=A0A6A6D6L8_9PEZI|nr:RdRP-domain-containing protein [Zopfia rhizophila CBS 207.26]
MDIHINNLPNNANHNEVRLFLRDKLLPFDILAFDCFKRNNSPWANITVSTLDKARRFLDEHGEPRARAPLTFRGRKLRCNASIKGQPDWHKIQTLLEEEQRKRGQQAATGVQPSRKLQPIFDFKSAAIGIWRYNLAGELGFDGKYMDKRHGTVIFGKSALVLYLAAGEHSNSAHFRVDISYAILEHVIGSSEGGFPHESAITFTLNAPPKIYQVESKHDLHLYSGRQEPHNPLAAVMSALSIGPKVKRLKRLRHIDDLHNKVAGLCMTWRVTLDKPTFENAWVFVRRNPGIPEKYLHRIAYLTNPRGNVEREYAELEAVLADYHAHELLKFDARFQLLALALEGFLTPKAISKLLGEELDLLARLYSSKVVAGAVRQLPFQLLAPSPFVDSGEFKTWTILKRLERNMKAIYEEEQTFSNLPARHNHLANVHKAIVTPTGLFLRGPDPEVSNRVLRRYSEYSECFMRVTFADEDGMPIQFDQRASLDECYERFRMTLRDGITLAGRKYEFLGFSHSSLHTHSCWFMASFSHRGKSICAEDIIKELGDFSRLHCCAKCAARIGQAFSDTMYAISLPGIVEVEENVDDVERNGRCFSDGCGTISQHLLRRIWKALPPERRLLQPTVLQIRYKGAKGIVSLDSRLSGERMRIRKSMIKFEAKDGWNDIEICGAAYKPLPMYLNHQFIKILEDLGVPPKNFIDIQAEELNFLKLRVRDPINAAHFLEDYSVGTSARIPEFLRSLNDIGLSFQSDRFLTDMIEIAAMTVLRELKYRARIQVRRGDLLYGIMDETGELEEGEVYVAIKDLTNDSNPKRYTVVQDRVIITRAPALHPGDVQIVKAVNVPAHSPLKKLSNCIVFSQKGARDLPSQLSGGDLDGDLFHIIYDERLIPKITEIPADYPRTPPKDLGRPVRRDDMIEFFIEYMQTDQLGRISNQHKVMADQLVSGTRELQCIRLAELASIAVDFSKSGNPVNPIDIPRGSQVRPDFMAPGPEVAIVKTGVGLEEDDSKDIDDPDSVSLLDPDQPSYRYYASPKILGTLYRRIDATEFLRKMENDFRMSQSASDKGNLMKKIEAYVYRQALGIEWEHWRDLAKRIREYYEGNMLLTMDSLRPHRGKRLTELEVFTGSILGKKMRSNHKAAREANIELRQRTNREIASAVSLILNGDEDLPGDDYEALPRAIACFAVAMEEKGWESPSKLESFKYVAAAVCLEQLFKLHGGVPRPVPLRGRILTERAVYGGPSGH